MTKLPWYQEGLHFGCTECGKCCTGAPGYVWVTPTEVEAIAAHTGRDPATIVRKINGELSLTEQPDTFACPFLKENKCGIYSLRPQQCRTFPWWKENLESREAWARCATECEGIRPDAPLFSAKEIAAIVEKEYRET